MPKVIYDKILGNPLLYTNMHLQLTNQSLCYPKGILEDAIIRVGQSYVQVDFMVLKTGGDERAPIISARPFLSTVMVSSTQTPPRSVSLLRIRRRSSRSRTVYYILPLIRKRHTCPKRQQQWPRRRRTEKGGRTRSASHLKRQSA
jgi:hypothetical protein